MKAVTFDAPDLIDQLEHADIEQMDDLSFGLVTMDRAGTVLGYNTHESERAGFARERVLGLNFFETVAPCTNNYLVAQRYVEGLDLDETLDYVFTVRMEPTPVRLRLLAAAGSARQYLAVSFR